MSKCKHEFNFHHHIIGFTDTNLLYIELSAKCTKCGKAMLFPGKIGCSPHEPRTSVDLETLTIPMRPKGEPLTGNPVGYNINIPDDMLPGKGEKLC